MTVTLKILAPITTDETCWKKNRRNNLESERQEWPEQREDQRGSSKIHGRFVSFLYVTTHDVVAAAQENTPIPSRAIRLGRRGQIAFAQAPGRVEVGRCP